MTVTIWPTVEVEIDLLDEQEANPNEMSDDQFSLLVEEIAEFGWKIPISVVGPRDGRYTILGGHHRVKAAIVLGMEKVSATIVDPETFDRDMEEIDLVKQNVLHGDLNPEKFTSLYSRMLERYDGDSLRRMMAFTSTDAFEKVYLDAKKALPPEMQDKLESVRDELKTVDDLSLVLNRLFTEYGNTVQHHFMFLSWGGREHLMVMLKQPGQWHRWKQFADWCMENGQAMDEAISARMQWPT